LIAKYPINCNQQVHIGWHEAVDEIVFHGIQMPKLVVCPKTGTILPEYYLAKEE
jgi:hypothetical protein